MVDNSQIAFCCDLSMLMAYDTIPVDAGVISESIIDYFLGKTPSDYEVVFSCYFLSYTLHLRKLH